MKLKEKTVKYFPKTQRKRNTVWNWEFGIWRNQPERWGEKRRRSRRLRGRARSIRGRPPVTVASSSSGSNSPSRFCFSYPPWACSKIQIRNLLFSLRFSLSWVCIAFVSFGMGRCRADSQFKGLGGHGVSSWRPYYTARIFFNGWIELLFDLPNRAGMVSV
jgi:hypothetical protein